MCAPLLNPLGWSHALLQPLDKLRVLLPPKVYSCAPFKALGQPRFNPCVVGAGVGFGVGVSVGSSVSDGVGVCVGGVGVEAS